MWLINRGLLRTFFVASQVCSAQFATGGGAHVTCALCNTAVGTARVLRSHEVGRGAVYSTCTTLVRPITVEHVPYHTVTVNFKGCIDADGSALYYINFRGLFNLR